MRQDVDQIPGDIPFEVAERRDGLDPLAGLPDPRQPRGNIGFSLLGRTQVWKKLK